MDDVLLDDSMDLQILNGDFVLGQSAEQNQRMIIMAEKGELRSSPDLGVGVSSFIDDDGYEELLREIRTNLRADGIKVGYCGVTDGKIVIKVKQ